MRTKKSVLALAAVGLMGTTGVGVYQVGINHGMKLTVLASSAAAAPLAKALATDNSDKKILYWHDPMVPGQKFDKPGKSPFMDMQLVPVYADSKGDDAAVTVNPRLEQNLGIRTAQVTRGNLSQSLVAVGNVVYNERDVAQIQARSGGFVERLHVRAPLDPVHKGEPLVDLYVPEWIAAQEEYLTARRLSGPGSNGLASAARQRMQLAGMNEAQIRLVLARGKVQPRSTVVSPIDGVVTELAIREGMTVSMGAPLFRINGLGTVWVNAEVPENLAYQIRVGNRVQARTSSLPGTVFEGKVSAILPDVNPMTRTLKARIELANPTKQLVPGMFVTVNFVSSSRDDVVLAPTEAVIQTGTRNVVIVVQDNGQFAPVDVQIGAVAHGQTEIRKGLIVGQKVVASGQFLIDSEASLKGTANRMGEPAALPSDVKAAEAKPDVGAAK
ncbi:MAG: efflux RND transporter periplasmic adaptor subunit [Burkholderiaceae bacterium]